MRPVAVLLLAAIIQPAPAGAQPGALTVREAVSIGLAHSARLRASAAEADGASARAAEAATMLLPSLRLEASYTRLSEVSPFEIRLPSLPAPVVVSPTLPDNTVLRLGLQQPLFAGFRLRSNALAADLLAAAAAADHMREGENVVLAVTTAYWMLYGTLHARGSVDENVTRVERHLQDTKRLVAAGTATRDDSLRMQVQLAAARLSQIDAEADMHLARMQLNTLLGLPLDSDVQLASVPADSLTAAEEDMPGDSGVDGRVSGRHDLRAMALRVDAARYNLTAAHAGWWPRLTLSGGILYARPNQRYFPVRDEFLSTWDIGVSLQWDIWNWLAPLHQTDQAAAQARKAEWVFEQMKDNAVLEVARARLAMRRAAAKIGVARTGIVQAEQQARSLADRYRTGLATSTELLDAEVALLQAENGLTVASVEYEVASARLSQALGAGEKR